MNKSTSSKVKKKTWTEDEKNYLIENYGNVPHEELEEHLGRSFHAIRLYAQKHGIPSATRWSKEEDMIVIKSHGLRTCRQIGKQLGRSEFAVQHRIERLGLGYARHASDAMCVEEVARLLGKSSSGIRRYTKNRTLKSRMQGRYRMVRPVDLYDFMKKNPDKWKAMNCEQWYFADQEWFHERLLMERKEAFDKRWAV